jgi:ATP adenylyltransferase
MEKLWAPWRMVYIERGSKSGGCFICEKLKEKDDAGNFILQRTKFSVALMNTYPYTSGHIMVAPVRHIGNPTSLTDEELLDKERLVNLCIEALTQALTPEGFNVGANIGDVAGAGLVDHFHIHIVPRWKGDTNFMPVISETRVINEALSKTYEKLLPFFKKH